jgi:hypothetical protein
MICRFKSSSLMRALPLDDFRTSGVKLLTPEMVVPFHQRSCFEMHITYQTKVK